MNLSSPHPYDPMKVRFPKCYQSLEDELGGVRYVSAYHPEEEYDEEYCVFDMKKNE